MKVLPLLDIPDNSFNMSLGQSITIVVIVYISVVLYTALLVLEIHNLYRYIYLKGKYELVPLFLFYFLSIPCTVLRIYENI